MTEKFDSVEEYFGKYFPHLVSYLTHRGNYWPRVKDNSISNEELARHVLIGLTIGSSGSMVTKSSAALLAARTIGVVP